MNHYRFPLLRNLLLYQVRPDTRPRWNPTFYNRHDYHHNTTQPLQVKHIITMHRVVQLHTVNPNLTLLPTHQRCIRLSLTRQWLHNLLLRKVQVTSHINCIIHQISVLNLSSKSSQLVKSSIVQFQQRSNANHRWICLSRQLGLLQIPLWMILTSRRGSLCLVDRRLKQQSTIPHTTCIRIRFSGIWQKLQLWGRRRSTFFPTSTCRV